VAGQISLKEFLTWMSSIAYKKKDKDFLELMEAMEENVDREKKMKVITRKRQTRESRESHVGSGLLAGGGTANTAEFTKLKAEMRGLRELILDETREAAERHTKLEAAVEANRIVVDAAVQTMLLAVQKRAPRAAMAQQQQQQRAKSANSEPAPAGHGNGNAAPVGNGHGTSPVGTESRDSFVTLAESGEPLAANDRDEDRIQDGPRTSVREAPGREVSRGSPDFGSKEMHVEWRPSGGDASLAA
jgi:hypothetical protein